MKVDEIKAGSTQRSTEILEAAYAVSINAREGKKREKKTGKKIHRVIYTFSAAILACAYINIDINPAAQKNTSQSVLSKAEKSGDLADI